MVIDMKKLLIVVDMQNDFIDGVLGTKEAQAIVPGVREKIKGFKGMVIYTRDTHGEDYLESMEGKNLPYPHCIKGTKGWEISPLLPFKDSDIVIDKPTFGSVELIRKLIEINGTDGIESITVVGLCTDICVISNAIMIKAALPEIPLAVDASCCAGVTPASHNNALDAMEMCQILIENRKSR